MSTVSRAPHDGSDSLLREGLRLFLNRSQPYALQQSDGSYRWIYELCDPCLLGQHVKGNVTLALSSTDARGWCRWVCLDCDAPASDAVEQLVALRSALAQGEGLAGVVEASRRGGHLWLFFDEQLPAVAARFAVLQALDRLARRGMTPPLLDLYPDSSTAGTLGHAVRLPLGIHRRTNMRYPLLDDLGQPIAFESPIEALAYLIQQPRVPAIEILTQWERFANGSHERRLRQALPSARAVRSPTDSLPHAFEWEKSGRGTDEPRDALGTTSPVIRWVDAEISPIDLLDDLMPTCELHQVGQGYIGWCPFHDDRAPDALGMPGTPSFYVVHNHRYGWSWCCFSTNCAEHDGPMRHTFRLFCLLLGLDARSGIVAACERWPEVRVVFVACPSS